MTAPFVNALGAALAARMYRHPIFQVGASRSGTIVLYKALGTHPNIFAMPSEDPLITLVAATAMPFEQGNEIQYFEESVRIDRQYLYGALRRLAFESAAGPHHGWKTLLKTLRHERRAFFDKTHWCVKCFPREDEAHALLSLYPGAPFIYIVRNGIDVVQSRTKFPAFRDQPFDAHCLFWARAADKFTYLTRFERAVQIQQEEMLAEPESMFDRILDHLRLPRHPNPARFVRTTLVHSQGDTQTHTNVDVRKSLTERPPGYADWSREQRDTFKRLCGHTMETLGYAIPF